MAQTPNGKIGIQRNFPQLQGFYEYADKHTLRLHPVQQALREKTASVERSLMLGDAGQMQFLQSIVRMICARKTLDIGVYTGYSALSVALALPDDGRVVALDVSDEYTSVGKPFWKEAGVDNKIDLRIGPAKDSLQKLVDDGESGTFDYAFIDADKPGYDAYYEYCLKLLRPGGVIVFDNMFMGGSALDEHVTDPRADGRAIPLRTLAAKLHKDVRVDVSMLLLGDGTTIARIK